MARKEPTCRVNADGTKEWRLDGKRHREDGPAVIFHYGTKLWYIKGKIHREDGPAAIYPNGEEYWYFNDEVYNFNDWCKLMNLSLEKIVEMKLVYG